MTKDARGSEKQVGVVPGFHRNATVRVMKHVIRDRALTDQTWDLDAPGFVVPQFERR